MRNYCIGMMIVGSIGIAITFLGVCDSIYELTSPEASIHSHEYSKYVNFEYYKEKHNEEDKNCPCKKKDPLTDDELKKKWETFKAVTITDIKHEARGDFFGQFVSFFVFGLILGVHYNVTRSNRPAV